MNRTGDAPPAADALAAEGLALQKAGRLQEAEALYRRALALNPDLPRAHNNLGAVLQGLGRFDEAAACHRAALALKPDYAEAQMNLGAALHQQGRLEEAVAAYRAALTLKPGHVVAHANLGLALERAGALDEAVVHHRAALAGQPDNAALHNNLALALQALGRLDEAAAANERAIALRPDFAEAHTDLGMVRLTAGDFAGGWPEYEWRLKRQEARGFGPALPRWDGGDLGGQAIILQAEQGLGDTIQFIRYAPMVAARGGRVFLSCRSPLTRLLAGADGVERALADGEATPEAACWAPLPSLPGLFGATLETIPAAPAYLSADAALIAAWRARLEGLAGFKVGVVWRGNPEHRNDRRRSIAPELLAGVLNLPGLSVVTLQQEAGAEEIAALGAPVLDAGPALTDFSETAALIANLDLVITVDTSVAHLAGALGAPVWTLISAAPDWRWMLGRDHSPWYPSMRLYRQPALDDWASVMARVRGDLESLLP